MPGPKMGPRPQDFDEDLIRQSPTFIKWQMLESGAKLRYACREFVKDHGDDQERLMRRIMIARRNNLRDHQALKQARRVSKSGGASPAAAAAADSEQRARRRPPSSFSDKQVETEMDVAAVEATRSYRKWQSLPNDAEFVYNQKYIKGREGHDWLLRKNIWRRMRYRRENKKLVESLKETGNLPDASADDVKAESSSATEDVASSAAAAAAATSDAVLADQAAVEAAVAAAESFGKSTGLNMGQVMPNPLTETAASPENAALEAAAKLAAQAATSVPGGLDEDDDLLQSHASV